MLEDVNKKAINSGKYLIIVGLGASAASYLVSMILGRVSSVVLGQYSLIISFLNLTTSIVCMGGATILSRFIIRESDTLKRSRLFFTYSYLTIAVLIVFSILLMAVPQVYETFVGASRQNIKTFCIICIMPIYTAVTVVSYFLISILESKISKIMGSMYIFGMLIVGVYFYLFQTNTLISHFYLIVFATLLVTNIIALCFGLNYIRKYKLLCFSTRALRPLIYPGAIVFTLCTLGQAILIYLYTNFDKIFLSKLNGMGQLGYYQAVLQIVMVVEMIPNLLGNVTIPYFSAIIGIESDDTVKRSYNNLEKMVTLFIASVVFGLLAISKPLLSVFGEEYLTYYKALIILLASKQLSSRGFLNTPMLVNLDKNGLRLLNSILQVALQIIIIVISVPKIGIYGAVIAKAISSVFTQIIPQIVIGRSKYNITSSKQYRIAAVIAVIVALIFLLIDCTPLFMFIVSVIAYILFFFGGGYSISEVKKYVGKFLKRK